MFSLLPLAAISTALLLSVRAASPVSTSDYSGTFDRLFVFGDSYSTVHFQVKGTQPNATNPIGNPAWPGRTTANGPNWVSDITGLYNSTLLYTYDFAVAGAVVDNNLVPPYVVDLPSFVTQVASFRKYYEHPNGVYTKSTTTSVEWTSTNTLFASWFGINDILNGYSFSNWTETRPQVVQAYFDRASYLHYLGAQSFIFLSVPPIWRAPLFWNTTKQIVIEQEVNTFNNLLAEGLTTFQAAYPDSVAQLLNTTPIFYQALDDPTAYAARDATCYSSNGVSCLWWNDLHPGQAIHKLVAAAVARLTGI
ncbi:carbohydrate esterase family 16 protein [Leptodontidium sp. 2 PMI_412]|nr:carbohydrate esterase family 16 protein [Leptodontidium sp. 2 PMI_412]